MGLRVCGCAGLRVLGCVIWLVWLIGFSGVSYMHYPAGACVVGVVDKVLGKLFIHLLF